jgi:hypothetical protein
MAQTQVIMTRFVPVSAPGCIAQADEYDGDRIMTEVTVMFHRCVSTRGSAGSILVGLTLIVILLCHAAAVSAQARCWTTGESTGTVDEADLNLVTLNNNTAAVSNTVTNATVDIRYNVVAVDGVFGGEENAKELTVRFADNGLKAFQEQRSKKVCYPVQFAGHFAHVFVPRVYLKYSA